MKGFELHDFQTTLKRRVSLAGVGVHSGRNVEIHLNPADPDSGIVFSVRNEGGQSGEIRALVSEIGATDLCTVLGDSSSAHVATVEHLMAAILALGIDNLLVEVEGNEIPILDGSAACFVDAIDQAGIRQLTAKRRYIRVLKPIRIESGASWAEFQPHAGTRFDVTIDFDNKAIGNQNYVLDVDAQAFRAEVARARTFGFMKDVARLWASGYALGSSLENSVVISEEGRVVNVEGLRYGDEFVRHKLLDAMGDLALAGARFIGCFRSFRGGHRLNAAALRKLLSDPTAFEFVETTRRDRGRSVEMMAVNAPVYAPWTL